MISKDNYNELRKKYWDVASWALWKEPGARPKSNVGDLSVFDDPELLQKINTGFVFVGLNGSGKHDEYLDFSKAWYNFHSDMPRGNDYKLRYALMGTPFWGSYITDIIKYYQEVDSTKAAKYAKSHPEVMKENIEAFNEELRLLGGSPVIVALGDAASDLIKENFCGVNEITKIKHYAFTIGKEDYRAEVIAILSKYLK